MKNTLEDLTAHFNTRMLEFQKQLNGSNSSTTSPTSGIQIQFNAFRSFVMTALENLQLQMELLSKQSDAMEMRTRQKILLLHGVPEVANEDVPECVSKVLVERLKVLHISTTSFSRCHRMGRPSANKPRTILLKFRDKILRDRVWSSKTNLKGSGFTLSEFLTQPRHKTFLAARQHFGVTKCWTQNGSIIVRDEDGLKHHVTTMTELNSILKTAADNPVPPLVSYSSTNIKSSKLNNPRPKRIIKK